MQYIEILCWRESIGKWQKDILLDVSSIRGLILLICNSIIVSQMEQMEITDISLTCSRHSSFDDQQDCGIFTIPI